MFEQLLTLTWFASYELHFTHKGKTNFKCQYYIRLLKYSCYQTPFSRYNHPNISGVLIVLSMADGTILLSCVMKYYVTLSNIGEQLMARVLLREKITVY